MKHLKSRVLAFAAALGLTAMTGAAHADALSTPSMAGPLAANPNPFSIDTTEWLGDAGGKIYIGGAVTGLVFGQSSPGSMGFEDVASLGDISNGQVFIQKTDGWLQFYVQAGIYSIPTLGVAYTKASVLTPATFGYAPVAYAKLVGQGDWSSFSIEGGKLPTLIGDEYTFSFENMNINRGLLWNLEPAISRGVQANYSAGPLTISVSLNDGVYSNKLNWISGLVSYAFNGGTDTLALAGGGNLGSASNSPTPLNAESVYNLIYTHTSGPWTISPYVQFNSVPKGPFAHGESVWGGALLVSYGFTDNWKLAARGEYESETGHKGVFTTPDIIGYGPGSAAWSFTLTPSYQWKVFYARTDLSVVGIGTGTPGLEFGKTDVNKTQFRAMLEGGILF